MTKYTREGLAQLQAATSALEMAISLSAEPLNSPLDSALDALEIHEIEYHFILCLQEEAAKEDGLLLADDGSMDTLLYCPECQGHLRFDGRESAIMHMENDDECWLCAGEEASE